MGERWAEEPEQWTGNSRFIFFSSSRLGLRLPSPRLAYRDYNTETIRGKGTSFRRNDFWDRLGGQALLMIG